MYRGMIRASHLDPSRSQIPFMFATTILVFDDGLVIDRPFGGLDIILGIARIVPHSFMLRAGAKKLRFVATEQRLRQLPQGAAFNSREVHELFPEASYFFIEDVDYAVIVTIGKGIPWAGVRFKLGVLHTDLFDIPAPSVKNAKNLLFQVLGDRFQDETSVSFWSTLTSGWRCRIAFEIQFDTIPGEEIYVLLLHSKEMPNPVKLSWTDGHIWRRELDVANENESGDVIYCYGYESPGGQIAWEQGAHCRPFPGARAFTFRDNWIGERPLKP